MLGSRGPLLEFWDTPNISGTIEARNFKFGTEMSIKEISSSASTERPRCRGGVAWVKI